jgi:hypothetical protein
MACARTFAAEQMGLAATVVAAAPRGDGYAVTLEAVLEAEYMRQRAQRDLIGLFEVLLDQELNVISVARKEVRERGTPFTHG